MTAEPRIPAAERDAWRSRIAAAASDLERLRLLHRPAPQRRGFRPRAVPRREARQVGARHAPGGRAPERTGRHAGHPVTSSAG